MPTGRFLLITAVVLGMLAGNAGRSPAESFAYSSYKASPTSQFGESCTATPCGDGQFASPSGMAVNDATGRVYVADTADNRVEYFSAAGVYEGQFDGGAEHPLSEPRAIAVDNSTNPTNGTVYVADNGHKTVDVFKPEGEFIAEITSTPTGPAGAPQPIEELDGIATDPNGNLLIYTGFYPATVIQYTNTGTYTTSYSETNFNANPGFAVDSNDNTYAFVGLSELAKFNPQGTRLERPETEPITGTALTVRLSSNNLFVDKESSVVEFGPFGEPFTQPVRPFATEGLEGSHGLAINNLTGTVYASEEQADKVDVFQQVVFPAPAAVTGAPLSASQTSARVAGAVGPEELPTSYYYQYGQTTGYGPSTTPQRVPAGNTTVPVSATFENLVPDTTYHYRLVAVSEAGSSYGVDHVFTTSPYLPPTVATGIASNVSSSAATLLGSVNPRGIPTTYELQLGTDTSYGARIFEEAGHGDEMEEVSLPVAGLQPATTYHFRLCATNEANAGDPVCGADSSFTTPGVAPGPAQPGTLPFVSAPAITFPTTPAATPTPKALTNSQKLANALKACKKLAKKKRPACTKQARKRYAPAKRRARGK